MSIVNPGYSYDLRQSAGGGGGTIDTVARTQITTLNSQVNGADGAAIPLGGLTTVDGQVYTPVGGPQSVPTPASNIATDPNFTPISGGGDDTVYDVITAANESVTVAQVAGSDGTYGVSVDTTAASRTITVDAGMPANSELNVANIGANNLLVVSAGAETFGGDVAGATLNGAGAASFQLVGTDWVVTSIASSAGGGGTPNVGQNGVATAGGFVELAIGTLPTAP